MKWERTSWGRMTGIVFLLVLACLIFTAGGRRLARRSLAIFGMGRFSGETEEVRQLETALLLAKQQLQVSEDLRRENVELRGLLGLQPPAGWKGIAAEVVIRDPVTWNWEVWRSRGSKDGISVGNPVLQGEQLAGRVVEVEPRLARVELLDSPKCRFSVWVCHQGERHFGIYSGKGEPLSRSVVCGEVDYLRKEAELAPGDPVTTSGLGEQLPAGLPVGTLLEQEPCPQIRDHARGLVVIGNDVDYDRLHFVTVLVPVKDSPEP